jgi:hypothetical protein
MGSGGANGPTNDGGVIHRDPTFPHQFFHVTRTQGVRHVPADTCENDLLRKMGPFEAHRHCLSPSLCTLDRRGKSYLKLSQTKIATEPNFVISPDTPRGADAADLFGIGRARQTEHHDRDDPCHRGSYVSLLLVFSHREMPALRVRGIHAMRDMTDARRTVYSRPVSPYG